MLRCLLLFLLLPLLLPGAMAQSPAVLTLTDGGPGAGSSVGVAPPAAPVVYLVADEMPAFPGGADAFARFLRAKIQYPDEALRHGTSGKVYVSFVVDEEGRIRDAKMVKGLGFGLDAEALRLVRIMPWWTPGRLQGRPVRVACTIPIIFRALE